MDSHDASSPKYPPLASGNLPFTPMYRKSGINAETPFQPLELKDLNTPKTSENQPPLVVLKPKKDSTVGELRQSLKQALHILDHLQKKSEQELNEKFENKVNEFAQTSKLAQPKTYKIVRKKKFIPYKKLVQLKQQQEQSNKPQNEDENTEISFSNDDNTQIDPLNSAENMMMSRDAQLSDNEDEVEKDANKNRKDEPMTENELHDSHSEEEIDKAAIDDDFNEISKKDDENLDDLMNSLNLQLELLDNEDNNANNDKVMNLSDFIASTDSQGNHLSIQERMKLLEKLIGQFEEKLDDMDNSHIPNEEEIEKSLD